MPSLLGWGDPGAAASAVIQFGTLLAAIIYFFRDIVRLIAGFFRGLITRRPLADVDSREAWLVVIGTIPIVVLGLLFKKHIESTFRGLWIVTTMVIVVAILMQIAEGYAKRRSCEAFDDMTVMDAVAIGLGQCLALIPGSSRSGSTIMPALFRGIDRPTAARYSFLLSIPAVGGAGVLELFKERHAPRRARLDADRRRHRRRLHLRLRLDLVPDPLPAHAHHARLHLLPLRARDRDDRDADDGIFERVTSEG